MKIKDLRKIIKDLDDDVRVLYADPNFSGSYHIRPEVSDFEVTEEGLLIDFPFEEPVD